MVFNRHAIIKDIAGKVKARRLEMNLTQKALSLRSGVPVSTYRKFEQTGMISLSSLVDIAFAMRMEQDFELLFAKRRYASIDEVIADGQGKTRKRGKIRE